MSFDEVRALVERVLLGRVDEPARSGPRCPACGGPVGTRQAAAAGLDRRLYHAACV